MTNAPQHWHDKHGQDQHRDDQHGGRLQSMIDVAIAAGKLTLTYYRNADLVVEAKADESPVTIADKSAEQLVRKLIHEAYPDDTVQGEEFADAIGASRYRWIVDPIDGTKSFVCGVPLYSTLLALLVDDKPYAGIIVIPALGETICAAYGFGCWYRATEDADWSPAKVSSKSEMSTAVVLTSQRDLFARRNREADYVAIENESWVSRTWGDGYGYLLVATGRAEIMIDPMCNPWDIAAMGPIMKEAGGRFTDWNGTDSISSGDGFATNGLLHDQVLKRLRTLE